MSTLANITSLNLSLQTGGAALAVNAVKSVAKPERTVYVFGTADDVAPNFTTVAGAITYANSLTPISTEPVVIRTFTKADGTPYTLAGLSSWTTYANSYIYFVSDFVRLNETTTLPTTLPAGQQVWYIDSNGVETLWVGREDGSAWPAVGYKEYVGRIYKDGLAYTVITEKNEIQASPLTVSLSATGTFTLSSLSVSVASKRSILYSANLDNSGGGLEAFILNCQTQPTGGSSGLLVFTFRNTSGVLTTPIPDLNLDRTVLEFTFRKFP
jgi:hypothetical protein